MKNIGIIGGGISSLMATYSLLKNSKDTSVTIFERGNSLENRKCPILEKKVDKCIKCKTCAIMEGIAGAGAFSDGKYNITTEFGGWLQDIRDDTLQYIEKADAILVENGATTERFMPNDELKKRCLQYDLHMLQSECKHLGTDANFDTMVKMVENIKKIGKDRVEILTNFNVCDVEDLEDGKKVVYKYISDDEKEEYKTKFDIIIFATGRAGSHFFSKWCKSHDVKLKNNQVDIGVRVELPSSIWEEFEKKIYEPKVVYRTKQYGDVCRMFCFNGRGEVVTENTDGILTVNGHAYKAEEKKTENTNFAILSTTRFTEPFNQPIEYARYTAGLANMISGGSVIVQRLGDLELGRRTDIKRLRQSTCQPTLKGAVPGDLSLCMPKRQLDNIIEMLHALDRLCPGTANYDTLLYGIECKYYGARPEADDRFRLIGKENYYAIGDGAGFTRSLAQASAQGLMVADTIMGKN
ncbi:MAG: FAD-dependent oxidoreductase [Clostridia bacterium]|nr:FAD-dependent oxidoreductase [Clostridia bacterium]